eukprot:11489516-Karenia_brevis.AAC.1
MRDSRGVAAVLGLRSTWRIFLQLAGNRKYNQHINVLEARSVLLFITKLVDAGVRDKRILILSDSRVAVGAIAKGRSSSRKLNFVLRRIAGVSLRYGLSVDVVWIPTWANPADAPSRQFSVAQWLDELPIWCQSLPPIGDLLTVHAAIDTDVWDRLDLGEPPRSCNESGDASWTAQLKSGTRAGPRSL